MTVKFPRVGGRRGRTGGAAPSVSPRHSAAAMPRSTGWFEATSALLPAERVNDGHSLRSSLSVPGREGCSRRRSRMPDRARAAKIGPSASRPRANPPGPTTIRSPWNRARPSKDVKSSQCRPSAPSAGAARRSGSYSPTCARSKRSASPFPNNAGRTMKGNVALPARAPDSRASTFSSMSDGPSTCGTGIVRTTRDGPPRGETIRPLPCAASPPPRRASQPSSMAPEPALRPSMARVRRTVVPAGSSVPLSSSLMLSVARAASRIPGRGAAFLTAAAGTAPSAEEAMRTRTTIVRRIRKSRMARRERVEIKSFSCVTFVQSDASCHGGKYRQRECVPPFPRAPHRAGRAADRGVPAGGDRSLQGRGLVW